MSDEFFPNRKAAIAIIDLELKLHPLARPVDIYKLLMQAAYGPGHLISDLVQATSAIINEMAELSFTSSELCQSLDAGYGYIRYSLGGLLFHQAQGTDALKEKAAQLANIMILSCNQNENPPDLPGLWQSYLPYLKSRLIATDMEWQEVLQLSSDNRIPSHSSIYRNAYHPHYRVIKNHLLSNKECL